jgi:NAD(P)-dependent dehydrogenase (short-subunit alcohol dehydrogenase family)
VLVISAGTFVTGDPFMLDPDLVDRMIDINVRLPFHAAVEAAYRMKRARHRDWLGQRQPHAARIFGWTTRASCT